MQCSYACLRTFATAAQRTHSCPCTNHIAALQATPGKPRIEFFEQKIDLFIAAGNVIGIAFERNFGDTNGK